MKLVLFVALGGSVGAVMRYGLTVAMSRSFPDSVLPLGTLIANIVGCFVIGLLAAFAEGRWIPTMEARAFIFAGLLGGFTTFSSFGLETHAMIRGGSAVLPWVYVALQLVVGIGAVALGHTLGKMVGTSV